MASSTTHFQINATVKTTVFGWGLQQLAENELIIPSGFSFQLWKGVELIHVIHLLNS